jgi:xanthine/CO dehydrogenase XdhC/CoxF family maturation factor
MGRDQLGQVDVAQRVAGDDEKRLVELGAREPDGACRPQRRLLDGILDPQPERLAVAEVAADRLRQECNGDDDVAEPVLAQQLEDVLHARLADDGDHRLRLVGGQRPQPRSLPAGHHDGLHVRTLRHADAA